MEGQAKRTSNKYHTGAAKAEERQCNARQWYQPRHRHNINDHVRANPAKHTRHQQLMRVVGAVIHNTKQAHQEQKEHGQNKHQPHKAKGFAKDGNDRVVDSLGYVASCLDAVAYPNAEQPPTANGDFGLGDVVS